MLGNAFSFMKVHVSPLWDWMWNQNMHYSTTKNLFLQLVHIHSITSLTIPWCNETRGCHSDAVIPPGRRLQMKRSHLIHLLKSRCHIRAILGISAGTVMSSQRQTSRTLPQDAWAFSLGRKKHMQRIETEPFPGMIALATQKPSTVDKV